MEPDGSVELDGIQAQFPGITGIKYRNPATQVLTTTIEYILGESLSHAHELKIGDNLWAKLTRSIQLAVHNRLS